MDKFKEESTGYYWTALKAGKTEAEAKKIYTEKVDKEISAMKKAGATNAQIKVMEQTKEYALKQLTASKTTSTSKYSAKNYATNTNNKSTTNNNKSVASTVKNAITKVANNIKKQNIKTTYSSQINKIYSSISSNKKLSKSQKESQFRSKVITLQNQMKKNGASQNDVKYMTNLYNQMRKKLK